MNVDDVFESLGVEEVRQTTWRIKRDVENKKEELRMLVGERYRDIIETADTIAEMRVHSQEVSESLNMLSELSRTIHKDLYLSQRGKSKRGFKAKENAIKMESNSSGFLAAQLKLVFDMPDLVNNNIQSGNVMHACGLFLVGQHTLSRLRLVIDEDSNTKCSLLDVSVKAVVQSGLANASLYRHSVMWAARAHLQQTTLEPQKVVESLLVLHVLDETSTEGSESMVKRLLHMFLECRMDALKAYLRDAQNDTPLKGLMISGMAVILDSLQFLKDVFLPLDQEGQDLFFQTVSGYARFSLLSVQSTKQGIYRHLEENLLTFQPFADIFLVEQGSNVRVSSADMQQTCHDWMEGCMELLTQCLTQLLPCCDSLEAVREVRVTFIELLQSPSASPLRVFNLMPLVESVKDAVLQQTAWVVSDVLQDAFHTWWYGGDVESTGAMKPVSFFEDDVLSQLVWRPVGEEYIRSLASTALQDAPCGLIGDTDLSVPPPSTMSLLWTCKLYTPSMQRCCSALDKVLKRILDTQLHQDIAPSDKNRLSTILFDCILQQIRRTVEHVHVTYLTNERTDAQCLFSWSRYLVALLDLCPHLAEVFRNPKPLDEEWSLRIVRNDRPTVHHEFMECWVEQRTQVVALSHELADRGLDRLANKEITHFRAELHHFLHSDKLLHLCLAWQRHDVEEENEESQPDSNSSTLYIPSQASLPVHRLLMNLCHTLTLIGAHMLPKRSVGHMQEHVCDSVLHLYEEVLTTAESTPESMSQYQALQLLFDVRFFVTLLSRYEHNKTRVHNVQSRLCAFVDPFDLEMSTGAMRQLVQQAVVRGQLQYALLSPPGNFITSAASTSRTEAKVSQQHNVLHMLANNAAASCARFMLLPIASQSVTKDNTLPTDAAPARLHHNVVKSATQLFPSKSSHLTKPAVQQQDATKTYKQQTSAFVNSWF